MSWRFQRLAQTLMICFYVQEAWHFPYRRNSGLSNVLGRVVHLVRPTEPAGAPFGWVLTVLFLFSGIPSELLIDYVNWEVLSYKQIWKKCDLYNYRVVEHEYHFTMYFNMSKIRLVDQLTFIVKWAIFTKRTHLSKQYMVYANVGIVVGLWTGVYIATVKKRTYDWITNLCRATGLCIWFVSQNQRRSSSGGLFPTVVKLSGIPIFYCPKSHLSSHSLTIGT